MSSIGRIQTNTIDHLHLELVKANQGEVDQKLCEKIANLFSQIEDEMREMVRSQDKARRGKSYENIKQLYEQMVSLNREARQKETETGTETWAEFFIETVRYYCYSGEKPKSPDLQYMDSSILKVNEYIQRIIKNEISSVENINVEHRCEPSNKTETRSRKFWEVFRE